MIGTDENRAVLHVEVIFWSGKRKIPPSRVREKVLSPFFGFWELRNIWVYAFWTEPSVHLIHQLWGMPSPSIQIPLTTPRWKTMRNF